MEKIWCLFSVENNYDQPEHNLVAWWAEKPEFGVLAKAAGFGDFPSRKSEDTLAVVDLWQGQTIMDAQRTSFRLEEIMEGLL